MTRNAETCRPTINGLYLVSTMKTDDPQKVARWCDNHWRTVGDRIDDDNRIPDGRVESWKGPLVVATPTPPLAGAELPTEAGIVREYRKKPVVIQAIQFTEESKDRCGNFVTCNWAAVFKDGKPAMEIQTLEGVMTTTVGDLIVKGVKGEFYPVKPDIFAATYEAATPPESRPLTISDDLPDLLFRRCGLSQEDTLKLAEEITAMVQAPPEASLEKALRRQKESHESIAAVLREGATAKGLAACIEQCEKFAEEARKLLGCVAIAALLLCTGCSPCPYPTDCKIGVDCNHCKRGLCQCCDGQCWCDAARTNQ